MFDSGVNLAGLERDKNAAIAKLHSIGTEATKTFQNEIARSLAKSVRPEVFAGDLAKSRALLQGFGNDANKIFEKALGRRAAQQLLSPFVDELTTLKGQFKSSLFEVFSLKNLAGGFLTASAITGAVRGLFEIGKATIAIARDAQETRNKFDVLFGGLKNEVREFANVYAQEVGRSRIQTENFLSTINGIFTTVGFAGREAAEFSKNITKLTFDLASFFNTTDAEALTALRSGLIGESEPLRRFNVFLSEARVAQEALAQGINKTSKELTEQDKIFLRYQIILKDTTAAQGDAVRTSDSLANQQKRLSANLENLGDTIGETLVPALADATAGLNTFLENLTKTFTGKNASLISSFFGGIREDAKRMQEELDAISKNRTTLLFPSQNNAFVSQADAIKKVLELQKGLTFETVTVEANRYEAVKKTSTEATKIADEFERAAEVLEHMGDIGKQFEAFQRGAEKARKGFESEQDEFERFKKEFSQAGEAQRNAKKERDEFLKEGEDALEDFLRKEAERLKQRQELIKQSAVDLADLVDQRMGDITASFIRFFDAIKNQSASGFSNLVGGFGVFDTVVKSLFGKSFFESILGGIFGGGRDTAAQNQRDELARLEREQQYAAERAAEQNDRLTQSLKDLKDALVGTELSTVELETAIRTNLELLQLFAPALNNAMLTPLQEAIKLFLASGRKVPETVLELDAFLRDILIVGTDAQKAAAAELLKILSTADAATREALLKAFGGLIAGLQGLSDFGKNAGREFDALIDRLNIKFDLLNIDDPIKKLDLLSKGIRDKFKAIIPTTDAGIRDLITQGLAALEAGGETLTEFLKSLDLEELTAAQFRDLLQLLNNLANEAKNKVDGIDDATTRVSLIRSITFEQGNRLLDENTTMRILQTNMVDIQMQMLSIMKDSLRGGLSSAALSRGGAANIFIMRDGNVRRASSSELTELERLQADRFLAEAKGMGLA